MQRTSQDLRITLNQFFLIYHVLLSSIATHILTQIHRLSLHFHTNTHILTAPYLECEQQEERFDTVETPVDKVAHEQVVCVWHIASHFEQLLQVIELAVDVTAYLPEVDGSEPPRKLTRNIPNHSCTKIRYMQNALCTF